MNRVLSFASPKISSSQWHNFINRRATKYELSSVLSDRLIASDPAEESRVETSVIREDIDMQYDFLCVVISNTVCRD